MKKRGRMQAFDWLISAALVAIGVHLGLVIDSMINLWGTQFWLSGIITLLLFGCWFVFYLFLERLFDLVFDGRFFAPKQTLRLRKPLVLVFSLPIGIVIGLVGGQFGLREILL